MEDIPLPTGEGAQGAEGTGATTEEQQQWQWQWQQQQQYEHEYYRQFYPHEVFQGPGGYGMYPPGQGYPSEYLPPPRPHQPPPLQRKLPPPPAPTATSTPADTRTKTKKNDAKSSKSEDISGNKDVVDLLSELKNEIKSLRADRGEHGHQSYRYQPFAPPAPPYSAQPNSGPAYGAPSRATPRTTPGMHYSKVVASSTPKTDQACTTNEKAYNLPYATVQNGANSTDQPDSFNDQSGIIKQKYVDDWSRLDLSHMSREGLEKEFRREVAEKFFYKDDVARLKRKLGAERRENRNKEEQIKLLKGTRP